MIAVAGVLTQVDAPPPVDPPHRAHVIELRKLLSAEGPHPENNIVEAGIYVIQTVAKTKPKSVTVTKEKANQALLLYAQHILSKGDYLYAAKLVWGDELFTADPASVKMIWDELPNVSELMIMGAGSMGKSYSMAVWFLLDWIRDPTMTCIKVLSSTETHAKRNVFAHIKNLHASAAFILPGERKEKSIQVGDDDKQGIHLMTVPAGDEGKGRLRGFHPVPRGTIHAQFGKLSRIRVILDEAEEIPEGVWEELKNILITRDGVEHVKAASATNPKDRNSKFGVICEPADGWASVNIETSEKWWAKSGARVIRLDGAKCENVVQRKLIYPGLITWEGFKTYLSLGDTSPEYYTMARGWFPEQGLHINVIPLDFVDRCKGMFIFQGKVTYCVSVDLAFEGGDAAPMTIGRFGLCLGWTPEGKTPIMFEKPRYGLQLEQQVELIKSSSDPNETPTPFITGQIKKACKNLSIPAAWVILDRTGNGTGVYDLARMQIGHEVMGLHWGEAATDKRILEDDSLKASEQYDGVVTELFFAFRKFMEFDYVKFGPMLRMDRLARELTNRRYKPGRGETVRVESKKDYKTRGEDSPDHADSAIMLVHLVRMRSEFAAMMLAVAPEHRQAELPESPVDSLSFITFE